MATEMFKRARTYPGFIAMKEFEGEDGERHLVAQNLGRERWYDYYHIEVAEVIREQRFTR